MRRTLSMFALGSLLSSSVAAQTTAPLQNPVEALRQQGYSVRTVTPIFGQLITLSFPTGFVPAFEEAKGSNYVQESVLAGESIKKWSQMVTLTGAKGLAATPNLTPTQFAGGIASGFKRACPDSYAATGLGETKFGKHDAFIAVVSCGMANPTGQPYSESMLLIVIKGDSDYYTVQWSERGEASKVPIKFDNAKWSDRFKRLTPIKLCPVIPGEKAPYPSCAGT